MHVDVCVRVCMALCICMCTCLCMCMCMCMCMRMYVCMYVCMHVYVCMYVGMYVCLHVLNDVCMYVCMHVCMYASMYMPIFIHACACICMYTHTCMQTNMYIYGHALRGPPHLLPPPKWSGSRPPFCGVSCFPPCGVGGGWESPSLLLPLWRGVLWVLLFFLWYGVWWVRIPLPRVGFGGVEFVLGSLGGVESVVLQEWGLLVVEAIKFFTHRFGPWEPDYSILQHTIVYYSLL